MYSAAMSRRGEQKGARDGRSRSSWWGRGQWLASQLPRPPPPRPSGPTAMPQAWIGRLIGNWTLLPPSRPLELGVDPPHPYWYALLLAVAVSPVPPDPP